MEKPTPSSSLSSLPEEVQEKIRLLTSQSNLGNQLLNQSNINEMVSSLESVLVDLSIINKPLAKKDPCKQLEMLSEVMEGSRMEASRYEIVQKRQEILEIMKKEVVSRLEFQSSLENNPEKVSQLLESAKDSKDKASLLNKSSKLYESMCEDRTSFLFHLVFPKLYLNGYLRKDEALACRLVSKEWKNSADSCFQTMGPINPETPASCPDPSLGLSFSFTSALQLQKFIDTYRNFPCPIFSRSIHIGGKIPHEELKKFFENLQILLTRWGTQIQMASFDIVGLTARLSYQKLAAWLSLMPNLQALMIRTREYSNSIKVHTLDSSEEHAKLLKDILFNHPLPNLPYLTTLYIAGLCIPVISALFNKTRNQLKTIVVKTKEKDLFEIFKGSFPSCEFILYESGNIMVKPGAFKPSNFPALKQLHLKYTEPTGTQIVQILKNVANLSIATLHTLSLSLWNDTQPFIQLGRDSLFGTWFNLPHLKNLSLTSNRISLENLNFLLPLTSLETLTLNNVNEQMQPGRSVHSDQFVETFMSRMFNTEMHYGDIITFRNFKVNPSLTFLESNIWRIFPHLKTLDIGVITMFNIVVGPELANPGNLKKGLPVFENRVIAFGKQNLVYTRTEYEEYLKG